MTDQPTSERPPTEVRCPHPISTSGPAQCKDGHWYGSPEHPVAPAPEQGVEPPELLPCPFAHHFDQLRLAQSNPNPYVSDEADGEYAVVCRVCGGSTRRFYRRDMAVQAWNTRATRSVPAEWQPIETAPKNGTKVWVYRSNGEQSSARWLKSSTGGDWWYGLSRLNPTHWMPLPLPPKEKD